MWNFIEPVCAFAHWRLRVDAGVLQREMVFLNEKRKCANPCEERRRISERQQMNVLIIFLLISHAASFSILAIIISFRPNVTDSLSMCALVMNLAGCTEESTATEVALKSPSYSRFIALYITTFKYFVITYSISLYNPMWNKINYRQHIWNTIYVHISIAIYN